MRNKGFFWFLTILLTVVCFYQLSFTWVSTSVEKKADKEANEKVVELKKQAATTGDSALLPNGTYAHFDRPEGEALAKAAFVNQILKDKSENKVYPIFGSTFSESKKRSLAFGLDLVGGMSVTLEISVPEMVKNYARNPRDLTFKKPFESALNQYNQKGGDFISLFINENKRLNKLPVVRLLGTSDLEGLGINSTDDDVEAFLRKIASSSMDGVEQIMSKRINQFGVAQPNIQRDGVNNRLYIELPGVQDEATVAQKLQSTANLQFFETYFPSEIGGQWQQATNVSRTKEVKLDDVALAGDSTDTTKSLASLTSLGGSQKGLADYVKPAGDYAMGYVASENKTAVDAILRRDDVLNLFPEDLKFMWSADVEDVAVNSKEKAYVLYAIRVPENGKALVGGKDVKSASTGYDDQSGAITVDLSMTEEGADKWAEMTGDNVQRIVAITMDEVVYSAPRVQNAITQGNTQISGSFTIDEAKDLAGLLNGGALPAPCVIKEQTKVGPTIGAENSQAGLVSFLFAFIAVLIYMYLYYGKSGIAANIALAAAGIAGIVLTIGTAVDANILIFERIREEQYRGVDVANSISVGFRKALPSIIDANATHLLVAIILKVFGTGEIESFATTLIIGIFTSIFSAIVISKLVITAWLEKGQKISFFTKMSEGLFQNLNFDWVGKRKYFYIFSISVTVLGIAAMFTRGLKQSVEFTGGRTFAVKFEQKADIEFIRGKLSKVFVENGEVSSIDLKTKSNDYNVEIVTNYMSKNDGATEEVKKKLMEGLDEWIRFGYWQYSIGAIIGLAHDAFFVISIFALLHGYLPFSLDVNQAFIAAILTVIGYSMNDTVIVFDRIRENLRNSAPDDHHYEIINKSLNTTLSRTFNTSMILFVVVLIMFIFGGPAIKGFLFALLVGVVIGTYSSLCVATPILIDFSKRLKA